MLLRTCPTIKPSSLLVKLKTGVADSEEWIRALNSGSCARPRHQGPPPSRNSCHPDYDTGGGARGSGRTSGANDVDDAIRQRSSSLAPVLAEGTLGAVADVTTHADVGGSLRPVLGGHRGEAQRRAAASWESHRQRSGSSWWCEVGGGLLGAGVTTPRASASVSPIGSACGQNQTGRLRSAKLPRVRCTDSIARCPRFPTRRSSGSVSGALEETGIEMKRCRSQRGVTDTETHSRWGFVETAACDLCG